MEEDLGKSIDSIFSPINVVDIVNVEVTSTSAQQGPTSLTHRPHRALRRRQNILEVQSSGSIREVIEETITEAPSLTMYEAYNYPTKFKTQSEIDDLASKYCIPTNQFVCYLPSNAARACNGCQDLCVFKDALDAGLRFPLHPFIPDLLSSFKIHPAQIQPNGWKTIICFMVQCKRLGHKPKVRIFRRIFHIKNNVSTHLGWVIISHRSAGRETQIFNSKIMPDSIPGWKD